MSAINPNIVSKVTGDNCTLPHVEGNMWSARRTREVCPMHGGAIFAHTLARHADVNTVVATQSVDVRSSPKFCRGGTSSAWAALSACVNHVFLV